MRKENFIFDWKGENLTTFDHIRIMDDLITVQFLSAASAGSWDFAAGTTVLAVSGGLDSMVMATLFTEHGFPVVIAHLNYQLRGDESDRDAAFVKAWAEDRQLPFVLLEVDTYKEAARLRAGIQETARTIRYAWLEQVRVDTGAQWIATGHHLNDSVETALFHLIRGCGLRGLHGIPARNERIVRPLLGWSRADLENWAALRAIDYRTDKSNAGLSYTRNRIRHTVLPPILEINPDFIHSAGHSMKRLHQAERLVDWAVEYWMKEAKSPTIHSAIQAIDLGKLPPDEALREILLYEFFSPLGFSSRQIADISQQDSRTGARAESETHELQYDRGRLLWAEKQTAIGGKEIQIAGLPATVDLADGVLQLEVVPSDDSELNQVSSRTFFYADLDQLSFPLVARGRFKGDVFQPVGMDGHSKKLKKFFADEKMPILEKSRTWILTNGDGQIIWVIGKRGDARFAALPGRPQVRMEWIQ